MADPRPALLPFPVFEGDVAAVRRDRDIAHLVIVIGRGVVHGEGIGCAAPVADLRPRIVRPNPVRLIIGIICCNHRRVESVQTENHVPCDGLPLTHFHVLEGDAAPGNYGDIGGV